MHDFATQGRSFFHKIDNFCELSQKRITNNHNCRNLDSQTKHQTLTAMNTSTAETNHDLQGLSLIAVVSCVLSAGYFFLTNMLS